jgi:ribosomal subunit interface protein
MIFASYYRWKGSFPMQIPAKITFHNVDPSPALEVRVRQKIAKLDQRFSGLVGCHVVIEAAHHHQHKGRLYSVRIDVTLPGGELVISHHPGRNPVMHEKAFAAMNSAFLAIEKRLGRFKDMRRYESKRHQLHWQDGVVSNLLIEQNCGFIAAIRGVEVYFHRHAVKGDRFDELDIGSSVRFVLAVDEGDKGPQASAVRIKKAKAMHDALGT